MIKRNSKTILVDILQRRNYTTSEFPSQKEENMPGILTADNAVYRLSIRPRNCNGFIGFRLRPFLPCKDLEEQQITQALYLFSIVKPTSMYNVQSSDSFFYVSDVGGRGRKNE